MSKVERARMLLLKFLHVLSVFIAFAFTIGNGIAMAAIGRSADVRAIRVAVKAGRPFTIAGGIILIIGVVFGFAAAGSMQYPLNMPWLVAAYVMALLLILIGLGVFAPWLARLEKAAQSSPDDHPSPELLAVANDRLPAIAGPLSGLLWLGLLYVMIFKP